MVRLAYLLLALAILSLFAGLAPAQQGPIPGIAPQKVDASPKADASVKADAAESIEQRRARIVKLLDEARAESERATDTPPPGIDPREASDFRDAQFRLIAAYDIQLRGLEESERALAARKDAEAREHDWHSFDSPPPYSILMVDDLRDQEAATRDRIAVLEGEVGQIRIDSQRAQDELKRAEEATRRADEALASAATPEDKAREAWRRSLARMQG